MPDVLFEAAAPIAMITLNRPDKRNAVHRPMAHVLRAAFERFEADDDLRVAVLHGAGGHFCAGADLAAMGDAQLRNEVTQWDVPRIDDSLAALAAAGSPK